MVKVGKEAYYSYRKESIGWSAAAFRAGQYPKQIPETTENASAPRRASGVWTMVHPAEAPRMDVNVTPNNIPRTLPS